MTTPSYNDTNFRLQFPPFSDTGKFSMIQLQSYWTMGTSFINPNNKCLWRPEQLQLALDLMAAHMAELFAKLNQQAAGNANPTGLTTSASEGTVSIGMTPPPFGSSQWKFWLAGTPYGIQLAALLDIVANIGLYVGGLPERAAFRKVGGTWR